MFLDLIQRSFINLSLVSLLIFDECHHALGKKHPYRIILNLCKIQKGKNFLFYSIFSLGALIRFTIKEMIHCLFLIGIDNSFFFKKNFFDYF